MSGIYRACNNVIRHRVYGDRCHVILEDRNGVVDGNRIEKVIKREGKDKKVDWKGEKRKIRKRVVKERRER